MKAAWRALAAGLLAAVLALPGCGGGGGGAFPAGGLEQGGGPGGADAGGIGGGGDSVAGVGSGGTGISGEGVGSGGTGATADAGVGSVDGFGSIIVNGVRFDTTNARIVVSDAPELKLGMTVRVFGEVRPDLATGVATHVFAAADVRGTVESVHGDSFKVHTLRITTDPTTAFAGGLASAAQLSPGMPVQVHGLPGADGELRATRVERLEAPGTPVLSGVVRDFNPLLRRFRIGGVEVMYAEGLTETGAVSGVAEGEVVRVRASGHALPLNAVLVEPWGPGVLREGSRLAVGGLVTQYTGLGALQVDGVPVNATWAQVSGGPDWRVATGARVEVAGTVQDGVLVAERLRLRDGPESQEPPQGGDEDEEARVYSANGPIGAFRSASSFKIRGQEIDAGRPGVTFVGGTAADLRNGRRALVTGSRVEDDVLLAERVELQP